MPSSQRSQPTFLSVAPRFGIPEEEASSEQGGGLSHQAFDVIRTQ